ncbi:MAG: hypothetical protein HN413_03055 [Chloroflexi bacterium]|jgi:hypothetical protein|nr:hypothetical protein [Chloroflexota bacterium]
MVQNKFPRIAIWGMFIIGLVYFSLMIFPNLTGAQDWNMLSIFEKDEFAQYQHVLRMLSPGDTIFETLRRFVVYLHYDYGYPFYLFSALMLLPYRIIVGAAWGQDSATIMLILRQMVSVLPMIFSVALMVDMQTERKSTAKILGLFAFLLAFPAAVLNNLWWHPDSLSILLIVLTFYFLRRDDFRFRRYFYLAAVLCGMGVSVKFAGAFFALAVPLYILWGLKDQKLELRRALWAAFFFVAVMALGLVISNPLLLIPQTRAEILARQQQLIFQTRSGYYTQYADWNLTKEKIQRIIWPYYGQWFTLLLMLAGLIQGVRSPRYRFINVMILAFSIPYFWAVGGSTVRPLYYLPMAIPFASGLVHLFPEENSRGATENTKSSSVALMEKLRILRVSVVFPLLLLAFQFGLYLQQDAKIYTDILYREERSESIAFYHEVEARLTGMGLADEPLVIYRDLTAYVPPKSNYDVLMKWKLATYDYINENQPDVLLLEMNYVLEFTQPDAVENAVDPDQMRAWQKFYGDAYADELPGYRILYQNDYALALLREGLTADD